VLALIKRLEEWEKNLKRKYRVRVESRETRRRPGRSKICSVNHYRIIEGSLLAGFRIRSEEGPAYDCHWQYDPPEPDIVTKIEVEEEAVESEPGEESTQKAARPPPQSALDECHRSYATLLEERAVLETTISHVTVFREAIQTIVDNWAIRGA
jgi:hypothetical protein